MKSYLHPRPNNTNFQKPHISPISALFPILVQSTICPLKIENRGVLVAFRMV